MNGKIRQLFVNLDFKTCTMLKIELQALLDRANSLSGAAPETIKEYTQIVKLASDKLNNIQQEEKSPMLDAWLSMGLQELRNEITTRLSTLENLPTAKLNTELMYSRSVFSLAITNILMHL